MSRAHTSWGSAWAGADGTSTSKTRLLGILGVCCLLFPATAGATTSVLLIGDSITRGYVSGPTSDPFAGTSYWEWLRAGLGSGYDVLNAGCSGSSPQTWRPSAGGTACPEDGYTTLINLFVDRVASVPVIDIAVVMLGTNSSGSALFPPLADSVPNHAAFMTEITDGLLLAGARHVILMTAPPRPEEGARESGDPVYSLILEEFRDVVLDICAFKANVSCVDTHTFLSANIEGFFHLGDIHPNQAGHQVIATRLQEQIQAIPEPSSVSLLSGGLLAVALGRARSKRKGATR